MPTNIKKIHELFKIKSNKLDSNAQADLPPAFIDLLIWEALNEYVDIFYTGSDKQLKLGFESTQKRTDMLKDFVVSYPQEPYLSPTSPTYSLNGTIVTIFNLASLSKIYKHFLRGTVLNECNKRLKLSIEKNDHLDYKLGDEFAKPSSKWGTTLGIIEKDILKVYSDVPLQNLEISYIKRPDKPFFGGYNTLEFINGDSTAPSVSSAAVHIELNDTYSNILTDIMVANMAAYIGDYNKSQDTKNKIMTNN